MSFLKRLFGGSAGAAKTPSADSVHKGFRIIADPQPEGGQFRLNGTISKEIGGEVRTHKLIRADMFPSKDQCAEFTIRKAQQVIDEQGERIFD